MSGEGFTQDQVEDALKQLEISVESADEIDPRIAFAALLENVATELPAALSAAGKDGVGAKPYFEPAGTFRRRKFPAEVWLVDGLVKSGGTTMIGGEPKTGKTWVDQELVRALVTGTPAFGHFAIPRPMRGAYFSAEDLGGDVQAHFDALGNSARMTEAHWKLFDANLYVQPRGRALDITKDFDLCVLVASCRLFGGVDFVSLDPLRDIHTAEEDASDAMSDVMRRIRAIGILLGGATVIVCHHNKKGTDGGRGGQNMRGSGAVHGSTDSGIYLSGLSGNGETEFTNRVESEVKGARSAGTFRLTLKIKDDPATRRAVAAAWSVDRGGGDGKASTNVDIGDPIVAAIADRLYFTPGHKLTVGEIRAKPDHAKAGWSKDLVDAALRSMLKLELIEVVMQGRKDVGRRLTAKGAAFASPAQPVVVAKPNPATGPMLAQLLGPDPQA